MSLYLAEHKSTVSDITPGGDYWTRVVALDLQVGHYIDGMRDVGYECVGVLYDVLRVPRHRPAQVDEDSPEKYGRRVLEAISQDFASYYQRARIVRLSADVTELRYDTWQTASDLRETRRMNVWPRNPDACVTYGRTCEYLPVCAGEASLDDPLKFRMSTVAHEELDQANKMQGRIVLSQSAIRCFRACKRRYFYQYERQVRPLRMAEPLRRGKNLHGALNVWWGSNGDLEKALASLDKSDPFVHARESAMICGYHAHWGKPPGKVVAVEQEFVTDLFNPETGAKSRTFLLAGRVDAVTELQEG